MNEMEEYDGGGTYFVNVGESVKGGMGSVCSFEGELMHAGHRILRGERYVLAVFLYVEERVGV